MQQLLFQKASERKEKLQIKQIIQDMNWIPKSDADFVKQNKTIWKQKRMGSRKEKGVQKETAYLNNQPLVTFSTYIVLLIFKIL